MTEAMGIVKRRAGVAVVRHLLRCASAAPIDPLQCGSTERWTRLTEAGQHRDDAERTVDVSSVCVCKLTLVPSGAVQQDRVIARDCAATGREWPGRVVAGLSRRSRCSVSSVRGRPVGLLRVVRGVVRFGAKCTRQIENQAIEFDHGSTPKFDNKWTVQRPGWVNFGYPPSALAPSNNSPSDASSSATHTAPALCQCSLMCTVLVVKLLFHVGMTASTDLFNPFSPPGQGCRQRCCGPSVVLSFDR